MMPDEDRKTALHSFCREVVSEHVSYSITGDSQSQSCTSTCTDQVQMYAKELMTLGMFYLNYRDAIREGDGSRILTTWKYLLPIFRVSDRRNYSLEVLLSLYKYYYVFSERQASQFLWSRFVNTRGVPSKNKPADLHMEHLNRLCKDCISGLGASKTPKAISRIGKAIGPLQEVLDNFDSNVAVSSVSVKHKVFPADIDQEKIINELVTTAKVFEEHEGRFHSFFPNFRPLFSQVKKKRFENWITSHVKSWKYCQNR